MAASEILKTVKALYDPGETIEVRLKKSGKMWSGFYDYNHFDKLANDVEIYDKSKETESIYFTVNPVKDVLIALAHCRIKKAGKTTADKDTKYRKYLPIDIDPERIAGTCATDQAHDKSIELAYEIAGQLHDNHGWPEPFIGDSGNGAHIMYRIDQPNTPGADNLCDQVLTAIIEQYSNTEGIKVEKWSNAARIWKLYGTVNRKGDEVPDMDIHHRRSKLLQAPEDVQTVTTVQLKAMAAQCQQEQQVSPVSAPAKPHKTPGKFNLAEFMEKHKIEVVRTKKEPGRTIYVLKTCPLNPDHTGSREAVIMQEDSGKLGFKCHHDSCKDIHWSDVREKYEPGYKNQQGSKQGVRPPYFDYRNKFVSKKLADEALDQFDIITLSDTKEMLVYKDGVYGAEGGEDTIKLYCLDKLGDDFKRDRIAEVIDYIKLKTLTPRDVLNKVTWKINVKNGMYDVDNDRLLPHSPEYFSTIQLAVTYDPAAQCEAVDKFMYEVVTPEDVLTLVQYAGYCCTTDISQQRAVIVDGEGNNGKTVFVELVCALIGQSNVSEQRLQDLNNDRFSRAQLNGKLLNMFPDLPKTKLYDNSVFKMLTSDQWIDGEEKYIRKFRFRNTTKQLYSANKIPEVDDPDELAFFRRWISITFPESFEGRENKNLLSELTTEIELSGFFNIAMVGLRALREHGKFCYNKSVSDVQKIYLVKSDPVQAFLDSHVEVSDMNLLKTELYESFESYCENNKITNYPKSNVFGRKMKKIGYDTGRLSDTSRSYVWQNIGLKTEGQKNLDFAYVPKTTQTEENMVPDSDKKTSCLRYLGYSSIVVKYKEFYSIIYSNLYKPFKGFQNNLGILGKGAVFDSSEGDQKKKEPRYNLGEPRQNLGSQADRLNKLKPAVDRYEKFNNCVLDEYNYKTCAEEYIKLHPEQDYEQVLTDLQHGWNISDNGHYSTVRALKDLPRFKGVDNREYVIKASDVLQIPTSNAKGLIKKGAVAAVEIPEAQA